MLPMIQITTATQLGAVPVSTADGLGLVGWLIVIFWLLVLLGVAGLFLARSLLILKGYRRGSQYGMKLFLVTLPKFRSEEEAKKTHSKEEINQAIGVAESLFASIGGIKHQHGFRAWLLGREDHMSFEIVAQNKVIKFYFAAQGKLVNTIEQQLLAQYPDAHLEEAEDYNLFSPTGQILGAYLQFARPVGFPIRTYKKIESDPMSAITNTLSKLEADEAVGIQYIVRSAKGTWRDRGLAIAKRIQGGASVEEALSGKKKSGSKFGDSLRSEKNLQARRQEDQNRNSRISPQAEEAVKGIEEKASRSGMDANIRLVISAPNAARAQGILGEVFNAFSQFNIYEYGNSFVRAIPHSKKRVIRRFIYRDFEPAQRVVFNTEEMASLWHLPLPWTDTPNIFWMKARRAPAPINTPSDGQYLGYNMYRGVRREVFIKEPDRQRHMYIIGRSGSGKSFFIQGMAIRDIHAGHGVCVIDPHGDLAEAILGNIPRERIDDVVVFDPSDTDRPVGLNMLEAASETEKDMVVQEMIAVFYKLFPPEMIGPMFEHQMRNVFLTLMADSEHPGTLAEVPRMFTDDAFVKSWLVKLKDPVVRAFWEQEMAKTSDFHKSEMLGYLISKLGRFVENTMMRNIIGQTHSGFNIREIMDNRKILIVNLSKGKVGEVNAALLGLVIVAKLQMAALARADMAEESRKDFFLYIDEFQNFVTDSIATILSEARKYRLDLILAHQYMGQLVKDQKTEVRDAVLGNVGTMFVSRIGADDTEVLEKEFAPIFSGYDLINAEKYTWYTKMIIDNDSQKPFTLHSTPPPKANPELAKAIKELSRLKYGRERVIVEEEILERTQLGGLKRGEMPKPMGEI